MKRASPLTEALIKRVVALLPSRSFIDSGRVSKDPNGLARDLSCPHTQIRQWLFKGKCPNSEFTLLLQQWCEEQERKQQR